MQSAGSSVSIDKAYLEDVMYGRRKSFLISLLLRLLSLPYRLAIVLRRALYAAGVAGKKKIGQRVVSVGNLTLGGTGKTPAAINIAAVLMNRGKRPAVVSRGYGRRDESSILVVSDGIAVQVDTGTGGDEPVLIGSRVPGLPVVVGSDRFRAALLAHDRFANDVVILDDGFQHMRLARDLDIVLIDANDPFGNGLLFPAGILREPVSALARAHAVLITNSDRAADLDAVRRTIALHTGAPVFTSRLVPKDLVDAVSGEVKQLGSLRGAAALAVSGIARPASFLSLLRSLGADVRRELIFPDHHAFTRSDLAGVFQEAADGRVSMIVTTEKDAVRLRGLNPEGIWALRVELAVSENEEWERMLVGKL